MEKLQVILAVLKKQYFWVLCVLLLITSTVVWMMAVGSIKEQSQAHLSKIQAAMMDAKNVSQITQHPNEEITKAYNAQTTKLRGEVFQVWDNLYKRQRDSVLKWPAALGEKFIDFIQSVPFGDPIHVDLRDLYRNYVKTRWDELPHIIKAKPDLGEKKRGAVASKQAVPDWIVIWKDQDDIRRVLFPDANPTNEWVWTTQEDLWIYENLLNIIKLTNEGALGPHNAVISTIIHMDVGKQAASGAGGAEQRITSSSGESDSDESVGGSSSGEGDGLYSNRYVDKVGVPIADGLSVVKEEYKQVPVRLVLRMDPKEIPQLIVNCANADLPLEIQQVRVNVESAARGKRVEAPQLTADDIKAGRKVPHVEVAMQGVIYIFNPPNKEKLKIGLNTLAESTSATDALGNEGTGEAPPTDASSAFGETPENGAADPASVPADGAPMPAEDPATGATGTQPMTEPAPTGETPADPINADPMTTAPAVPAATEPDAAETPTEGEAPKAGAPKSLEDLFEE